MIGKVALFLKLHRLSFLFRLLFLILSLHLHLITFLLLLCLPLRSLAPLFRSFRSFETNFTRSVECASNDAIHCRCECFLNFPDGLALLCLVHLESLSSFHPIDLLLSRLDLIFALLFGLTHTLGNIGDQSGDYSLQADDTVLNYHCQQENVVFGPPLWVLLHEELGNSRLLF